MIETGRLILRSWRESDRDPFASMNADPEVMEFFPHPLTRAESDQSVDRIASAIAQRGWGFWAAELKSSGDFIGFIGISVPHFDPPFTPAEEIGWRLRRDSWGTGLATEGARAVVNYAFEQLNLPELVSFTTRHNLRSRRVMEKLGMTCDPADDFLHPQIPAAHPLAPHVLYRLKRGVSIHHNRTNLVSSRGPLA